ncbi:glycosyl transferase [Thermoplasma volcanium GSS1]|uniref:Glycosyl transferase n=1 Tax=Thermoplasma volcanium (strain ATCC 51530 / DSM 4299 / JCM 9571 / NBRC 15438 / GSS1) TaxID=273116 RepID=Q97A98_THEVO|nr:glycosyltransferase family 2 protein [Thermoplasma volcanium]BAB60054.1 glycosyl transferase [Thermoplasma volcanium GSS1]
MKYISVIITAYNRKEFLLDAIKSALNQTLDRKYYEIIVIKNFQEDTIDNFIKENNIKGIISENKSLGGKISEALKASEGEIVSFLEDDDMFDRQKLETVYRKFRENPDIVYYHNNQIIIDENGKEIRKNGVLNERKLNSTEVRKSPLDINPMLFNMSSISIRRSYYAKYADNLSSLITHLDDFMLFCALNESTYIYVDKAFLTYYRYHASASNMGIRINDKIDTQQYALLKANILKGYCEASFFMLQIFENKFLKELINFRYNMECLFLNFYSCKSYAKSEVKRSMLIYILKSKKIKPNIFNLRRRKWVKLYTVFIYLYLTIFNLCNTPFKTVMIKLLNI